MDKLWRVHNLLEKLQWFTELPERGRRLGVRLTGRTDAVGLLTAKTAWSGIAWDEPDAVYHGAGTAARMDELQARYDENQTASDDTDAMSQDGGHQCAARLRA